jgi:N-acetylglucosaminyldiphosphoundecaprenol N-acetyl-beta-D-mannosaminyltransferase
MVRMSAPRARLEAVTVDGEQTSPVSSLTIPPGLVDIDGQSVNVSDMTHAVEAIMKRLTYPESFLVCTLNLDHLVKLRRDSELREAYARAELVTADGFPIVTLGRLQGTRLQRAAGSDLIEPLCAAAAKRRLPVFFLGSTLPVLSAAARRLVASNPGLEIAGAHAPPSNFNIRSALADEAIDLIRNSGARLCFLALGAPLQEAFALRALRETSAVAFLPIGAGLDFLAGTQIRAPQILRKMNLEWAWRLVNDPRRLWPRYVRCGILFAELLTNELYDLGKRQLVRWDRV